MVLKVADKVRTFIPEFNGNKELLENEQIVIEIKHFPSVTEVKNYKNFGYNANGTVELKYNDAIMLSACVGRIKNLFIGSEEIKNGTDLSQSDCLALESLVSEIRDYIFTSGELITPGESKN